MAQHYPHHVTARQVERPIQKVRSALRRWSVLEGLALALIGVALILAGSLAGDYLLEPGLEARRLLLALLAIAVVIAAGRWIIWRLIARPSDESIALHLEKTFPSLSDRLMTAVELGRSEHPFSQALVERSSNEAAVQLGSLDLRTTLHRKPVAKRWGAGLLLAALFAAFVTVEPVIASVWARRTFYLADEKYPRKTHLKVIGFDGLTKKTARGRDFELLVEADPDGVVPETMQVRYRTLDSRTRGKPAMTKVGENRFRFVFRNLLESMDVEILGGDARTDLLHVVAVDPPILAEAVVAATYPKYTGLAPKDHAVAGSPLTLLAETGIEVKMTANKPLDWLRCLASGKEQAVTRHGERSFATTFKLTDNMPLKVTLRDQDGIESADPFPIDLFKVEDKAPEVKATLQGIGQAITRMATIPMQLSLTDDYGVAKLEFEFSSDTSGTKKEAITAERPDRLKYEGLISFDVLPLDLKPGQKLSLAVAASDADDLHGPHVGKSEQFRFEIVTPDELLARLATRELNLRQRFEQVIREIKDSRRELKEVRDQLADNTEKGTGVRRLHVERSTAGLRKNANETATIAGGFRDVLAELKNNRVGNAALLERIEQGIVIPMDRLGVAEFPEIDQLLEQLRESIGKAQTAESLAPCEVAVDRLLTRCDEILKAMMKLESFNEAVAMLRSIINEHEKVEKKTKDLRKKSVTDLLK